MLGKSRNVYINSEIVHQPWFIKLTPLQRHTYLYIHINSSQIGVYLHSDEMAKLFLGEEVTGEDLIEWFPERVTGLDYDGAYLLTKFLEEENKRATKIKPTSNPDLGKIREAISSGLLEELIEKGYFHSDCKLFEYGIGEGIIKNKSYSTTVKRGEQKSEYDKMIDTIVSHQRLAITFRKPSPSYNSNTKNTAIIDSHSQGTIQSNNTPFNLSKQIAEQLYCNGSATLHDNTKLVQGLASTLFEIGVEDSHSVIENALESLYEFNTKQDLTFERLKKEVYDTYCIDIE